MADKVNDPIGDLGTRNSAKTQITSTSASGLEGVVLNAPALDHATWFNMRCMAIRFGTPRTAEKVTITAPEGYTIIGYNISYFTVSTANCPYKVDFNETYTGESAPANPVTYTKTGVYAPSTYFWIYAEPGQVNNWLGVSEFEIYLEPLPGDITSKYLANPSFELSAANTPLSGEQTASGGKLNIYGWTMSDPGTDFNNTEIRAAGSSSTTSMFGTSAPSDGDYSLFYRHGWNGSGNLMTFSTTALQELPAGRYSISVDYKQHYAYDKDSQKNSNTKVSLDVRNGQTSLGTATSGAAGGVMNGGDATYFNTTAWSTLTFQFDIQEATAPDIDIKLNAAGATLSDFFVDNVRLNLLQLATPIEGTSNLSFDEGTAYSGNLTTGDTKKSEEIVGWTLANAASWCASAMFAYGSDAQLNNVPVPASAPEGSQSTAALGISVGWGGTIAYQQYITALSAGTYKVRYQAYNANTATRFPSKVGVIVGNKQYLSTKTEFASGQWVTDEFEFTLTEDAAYAILQVGAQAVSAGSNDHGKVFIDGITLERISETDLARAALNAALNAAQPTVDAKAGVGAELLQIPTAAYNAFKQAVDDARAVANNEEATVDQLQQATTDLNAAVNAYAKAEVNAPEANAQYTIQLKDGGMYMSLNEGTKLAKAAVQFAIAQTDGGYTITNGVEYVAFTGNPQNAENVWTMGISTTPYDWKITLLPDGYYTIAKASNNNQYIGVDNTEAGSSCYADKKLSEAGDKARWIIRKTTKEPDHGDSEDMVFNAAGQQVFALNNNDVITPNTDVQIEVTGQQIAKGIVVSYPNADVSNTAPHECGFRATAVIEDGQGNVFTVKSRGDKETNIINVAQGLFGPNEEYTVTIKPIVYYDYNNFCDGIYELWESKKDEKMIPDPKDDTWKFDEQGVPTATGSSKILDPAWTLAAAAQEWSQQLLTDNAGSTYFGTEPILFDYCDPLPLYVDNRSYVFLIKTDGSVSANVKALSAQDFKAVDAWGNDFTADFLSVNSGIATGVDKVNAATGADVIYNLAGQRVGKAVKGLYIQNGKKVAIK